ncbi:MAG: acyl-CoA dehydratase activase [Spirochaetes bacterium]|jgi:predicted CoA-substrate-specific enzyme activase|nr:acyl-CoA dehydratase activase [Spirochaetota bacterium]
MAGRNMREDGLFLGIDIGSATVSIAALDAERRIVRSSYLFHGGRAKEVLAGLLSSGDYGKMAAGIAVTSTSPEILKNPYVCDTRISFIAAAKRMHGRVGSIMIVGGERFGLIRFDGNGDYRSYTANSSCAAGTGSFLDQQAKRLNISGIEELCSLALSNKGGIPQIASRCAVFAKTDLIHAQQEGYTLEEICDGLCYGLAKNIVDTLFCAGPPPDPVIFIGGVSRNGAVACHIEKLIGTGLLVDQYSVHYGAVGAALSMMDNEGALAGGTVDLSGVLTDGREEKSYFYEPLVLKSDYPEFSGPGNYLFEPGFSGPGVPVEVEIYREMERGSRYDVFLGIDIGSTSTKAVIMDGGRGPIAGFYTRTSGRPLEAVRAVFESIEGLESDSGAKLNVAAAGTTGSGRKFIGSIIGADLVVDEISAHARAAFELDPEVDTIIEIGGQDSKFTTVNKGMVTFSVMNNVCAAGTGSFIEEQAQRLGCGLDEYSGRTLGVRSPMASDRCTVFMERDINHFVNSGYEVDEILAAVLHSVRDNYLSKVSGEARIGERICFQGATARNKALVAAFEQKLGRKIFVSRFCHITGAMGVALMLSERKASGKFRGLGLYRKEIPVKNEVCGLCANSCKLKIAEIDGGKTAFGFLCGRDYETEKFVDRNVSGFDLLKSRKRSFAVDSRGSGRGGVVLGIPATLHMYDELPLWKKFFSLLGIDIITSEGLSDTVKTGKSLAGAEFCAPIQALHAHAEYIADRCDHVFLPVYVEAGDKLKWNRKQYCYYTQFAPSLVSTIEGKKRNRPYLMPLINRVFSPYMTKKQIYRSLKKAVDVSFFEVSSAFDGACRFYEDCLAGAREIFVSERSGYDDVSVVLLGRPYTVLDRDLNKGIPGIFGSLGIKTFYQDMLGIDACDVEEIAPLLKAFHWNYARKILEAAEVVSKMKGTYPVLITSFKCAPDSFVIEYFKRIMDSRDKPYLILQIDEHDSSVGYETRIEAGIRSFRNHYGSAGSTAILKRRLPVVPEISRDLRGKTLLMPNWDDISCRLISACLKRVGIDARVLVEDDEKIRKGLKHNVGQCIPINAIAEEFIDYVEKNGIRPRDAVLWMMQSEVACNIKLYPYFIKSIFESYGSGFESSSVYVGDMSFMDISPKAVLNVYFAFMFGGLVRKAACRIRPYERIKGSTDLAVEKSVEILYESFLGNIRKEEALEEVRRLFSSIGTHGERRPKVAIFGDLYVRDNEVMNQNLVRTIEDAGGEIIVTPYSYYVKMSAEAYFRKWFMEKKYLDVMKSRAILAAINLVDRKYYRYFEDILGEPYPVYTTSADDIKSMFNLTIQNSGESVDNLIKIFCLLDIYPDISLFVQTSPAFCCPSLVTEAMKNDIERITGIPVVSLTYDGTGSFKNDAVIPYLKYPRSRSGRAASGG